MKHTISALVENRPGVLADMAEAFKSHELNIKSISCGETEDPSVSRMVICVEAGEDEVKNVTARMLDMDFVIRIDDLSRRGFVDRELALVKVAMTPDSTSRIMQIFEVFRANVVGMGEETVTAEITGDGERVDAFIKMAAPFGVKSMCRTGLVALKRGDD